MAIRLSGILAERAEESGRQKKADANDYALRTLQVFLNVAEFGMILQGALARAPSTRTRWRPLDLWIEGRIPPETVKQPERLSHAVTVAGDWDFGQVTAARITPEPDSSRREPHPNDGVRPAPAEPSMAHFQSGDKPLAKCFACLSIKPRHPWNGRLTL